MEDSLKSQPDKEGKVSKLSLFDIGDEYRIKYSSSTCSCKSNWRALSRLNSDQGSMVMGISEYLKEKAVNLLLVQGGAGTGKSFRLTGHYLE
jgi:hypothetical protein